MDNSILKQLLEEQKRVVLPGFGAFLKREGESGTELVFSPFLRKDDSVTTAAVVEKFGVEEEEAREMISAYIAAMRKKLDDSGDFVIEGIGLLTADANGTLTLKPEEPKAPEPVQPTSVPQPIESVAAPVAVPAPSVVIPPVENDTPLPQFRPTLPGQEPPVPEPQPAPAQQPAIPQYRPPIPGQQPAAPQQSTIAPPPQYRAPMPQQQPYGARPIVQQPPQPARVPQPGAAPRYPQNGPGQPRPASPQPQRYGQPPQGGSPGQPPMGPGGQPRDPRRRPPMPMRRKPKSKTDMWLILAIVAAIIVIGLMVYSMLLGDPNAEMEEIIQQLPINDTLPLVE